MLIYITLNQDGFIGMWVDKPERYGNKWKAKLAFVNSLAYNKVKRIITETQMNWESDPMVIPV